MKLPELTFKVLPRKEEEKGHKNRYEGRLLGRFSTLKRMIERRKDRINRTEKEKTKIEKEIRNLRKKIEKKIEYQEDLSYQVSEIKKELKVYSDFFKNQDVIDKGGMSKKPTFYIKTHTHKEGYQYYHGRIRYFMRDGRKQKEKWVYFGPVWELNKKFGEDKVKEELKEQLKNIYYSDLYGE